MAIVRRQILERRLRGALAGTSLSREGFARSLSRKRAAIDHLVPMTIVVRQHEGVTTMRVAEPRAP
jgi:hypothetical protein